MTTPPLPLDGLSVAGVETCIEVPSMKLVLDLGRCTRTAVNQPLALLSHGHMDHLGAAAHHAARRAMMKMSEGTYLVPRAVHAEVEALFAAAGALDGQTIPRKIVPLAPGERFPLGKGRFVEPFATVHRVPSQGYIVWETRRRLKDEHRGLAPEKIAELKRAGAAIDETVEVPLLAFTGDTRVEALETTPALAAAETLIAECTFLDDRVSVDEARAMGHIHLDELLARAELLSARDVVLTHFSARYTEADVARILEERLPDSLRGRVRFLFGEDRR